MNAEVLLRQCGFDYCEEAVIRRISTQFLAESYTSVHNRIYWLHRASCDWSREEEGDFLFLTLGNEDALCVTTQYGVKIATLELRCQTPST